MENVHSDEVLVATFVATQQASAFAELYRRYQTKVNQSCLQFLRDPEEANDQTQEIFCEVYTRLGSFRGEAKFSTWLFVLTRYHCLSVLDSMKKRTFVSLDTFTDGFATQVQPEEPSLDERWNRAETTLSRLSSLDQQLLRRRYMANKDVATLATEARVSQIGRAHV